MSRVSIRYAAVYCSPTPYRPTPIPPGRGEFEPPQNIQKAFTFTTDYMYIISEPAAHSPMCIRVGLYITQLAVWE